MKERFAVMERKRMGLRNREVELKGQLPVTYERISDMG